MLTARLQRLKDRALSDGGAARGAPGYRAHARMLAGVKYGAATWGQRRAFMLKALAEIASISIADDERVAGEHLFNERSWNLDFGGFDDHARNQLAAAPFDEDTKRQIAEFLQTEEIQRSAPLSLTDRVDDSASVGGWGTPVFWANGCTVNHSVRDFGKVIRIGFSGVRAEIERARAHCELTDPDYARKMAFWRSAEAVCDAGITLGRRYAELAASMAAQCEDPVRRQELLEIAAACRQVPEFGARTLREAVQALWFTHVLTCAEDGINANSIGRLDQYMHPYYRRDVKAGRISYEGAVELMAELACKLYRDYDVQQICLGGQTRRGCDAANDLTYAVLDATEQLGFIRCIVAGHFCDCLDRYRAPFGGFYAGQLFTFLWHLDFGRLTAALPDGRRAGEPLAYSLSPMQGRDAAGLTAMMKSLSRIPHHKAAGSSSAIIEIDPANFQGEAGEQRLADVIRTGIDIGVGQMQFNITTAERLLKAQQDPEHYGNVQVRVSGFSSKFSLLGKDLQNHIIARTKHRE